MAFYVGQKVVCVEASPRADYTPWKVSIFDMEGLTEGRIYTVRAVSVQRGVSVIFVIEINRRWKVDGREQGYAAVRFRPIVERKTDISIFKAMLNPSKQEVSA